MHSYFYLLYNHIKKWNNQTLEEPVLRALSLYRSFSKVKTIFVVYVGAKCYSCLRSTSEPPRPYLSPSAGCDVRAYVLYKILIMSHISLYTVRTEHVMSWILSATGPTAPFPVLLPRVWFILTISNYGECVDENEERRTLQKGSRYRGGRVVFEYRRFDPTVSQWCGSPFQLVAHLSIEMIKERIVEEKKEAHIHMS